MKWDTACTVDAWGDGYMPMSTDTHVGHEIQSVVLLWAIYCLVAISFHFVIMKSYHLKLTNTFPCVTIIMMLF